MPSASQMRDKRIAESLNTRGRTIGGPLPDPRWDGLFGALQDTEASAAAAGKRFRMGFLPGGGVSTPIPASIAGLRKASR